MTAPACPRVAAELTDKILEVEFTDEIKLEWYRAYIWIMHALLKGGWIDLSSNEHVMGRTWLQDHVRMWDVLQPWLTSRTFTQEDLDLWFIEHALFDKPPQ
jgi:hypothetical protein